MKRQETLNCPTVDAEDKENEMEVFFFTMGSFLFIVFMWTVVMNTRDYKRNDFRIGGMAISVLMLFAAVLYILMGFQSDLKTKDVKETTEKLEEKYGIEISELGESSVKYYDLKLKADCTSKWVQNGKDRYIVKETTKCEVAPERIN